MGTHEFVDDMQIQHVMCSPFLKESSSSRTRYKYSIHTVGLTQTAQRQALKTISLSSQHIFQTMHLTFKQTWPHAGMAYWHWIRRICYLTLDLEGDRGDQQGRRQGREGIYTMCHRHVESRARRCAIDMWLGIGFEGWVVFVEGPF